MLAATLAAGHTIIEPAAQEPEVDDLIAFLQKMGAEVERTRPDTHRGRGPAPPARRRPRASSRTGSRPARSSWPRRSPAATSRSATRPASHFGAFLASHVARWASRSPAAPTRSRWTRTAADCGRSGAATWRRRPTRASRPTSSRPRACCSPRPSGDSHVARDDLRGPPGVARRASPHGRPLEIAGQPSRHHSRPDPAPRRRRSRSATSGPARR